MDRAVSLRALKWFGLVLCILLFFPYLEFGKWKPSLPLPLLVAIFWIHLFIAVLTSIGWLWDLPSARASTPYRAGLVIFSLLLALFVVSVSGQYFYRKDDTMIVVWGGSIGFEHYYGTPEQVQRHRWWLSGFPHGWSGHFARSTQQVFSAIKYGFGHPAFTEFTTHGPQACAVVIHLAAWLPLVLIGAPTMFLRWRERAKRKPGHCKTCGYDLTGNVSGVCPECGTLLQAKSARPNNVDPH